MLIFVLITKSPNKKEADNIEENENTIEENENTIEENENAIEENENSYPYCLHTHAGAA